MMKRTTLIVAATVVVTAVAAMIATPAAQAQYYNYSPPVRVEVVPARPAGQDAKPMGYWQPGYWSYQSGQRVWVAAHWVDTYPRNRVIEYRAAPTYREPPMGYRYVPGHWTYD